MVYLSELEGEAYENICCCTCVSYNENANCLESSIACELSCPTGGFFCPNLTNTIDTARQSVGEVSNEIASKEKGFKIVSVKIR